MDVSQCGAKSDADASMLRCMLHFTRWTLDRERSRHLLYNHWSKACQGPRFVRTLNRWLWSARDVLRDRSLAPERRIALGAHGASLQ